jgi:predicted nucleotidyltransferase
MAIRVNIDQQRIAGFARKWGLTELAVFGSVLRDDFRPDSDIDVLIELPNDHPYSAFDLVPMRDELEKIFGRPVDLVLKGGLRNPIRRRVILDSRRVLYAA